MNTTVIKALLLKAIQPRKVKYTLIHESSNQSTTSQGKNYEIVCQSVKLPLSKKEIMELSDEQAKLLETILKYRKIEKTITKYEKATQPKNQLNQ